MAGMDRLPIYPGHFNEFFYGLGLVPSNFTFKLYPY